jgi:hypothetical protein
MTSESKKVSAMHDAERWVFPVEPAELVQILRDHSIEKVGPFSWKAPRGDSESGLFLDTPKKSGKGGFHCEVKVIHYWKPGKPIATGTESIITLRISKARGKNAAVVMKCQMMEEYGAACQHFTEEMDVLLAELASSVLSLEQDSLVTAIPGLPTEQGHTVATMRETQDEIGVTKRTEVQDVPRPGHPGLDHDELIYRLAKAQEGEELKQADKSTTWRWIAREIKWNKGSHNAGLALLRDARARLGRLDPDDALLAEVAAWRRAQETRKT